MARAIGIYERAEFLDRIISVPSPRNRMDLTKPIWRLQRAIICAFSAHFNLHMCGIVSERQHAKGDWGRKSRPNFAIFLPYPCKN